MQLIEVFKDFDAETQSKIKEAIEKSGGNFKDLTEGNYVDKDKFDKLQTKFDGLEDVHKKDLDTKIKEVTDNNDKLMSEKITSFKQIIKNNTIDNFVSSLNIKDEYAIKGIKADLLNNESIVVADDYKVSGTENLFKEISDKYKNSADTGKVVGTINGSEVKKDNGVNNTFSISDIDKMSESELTSNSALIHDSMKSLGLI